MNLAAIYRAAAWVMFAPFGGLAAMRRRTLDALGLGAGARVLELGCGPGDMTRALLARGAHVDAVDSSPEMIKVARAQAPTACFELADITHYVPIKTYDVVLMAFVLHELRISEVPGVIKRSAAALTIRGQLAVLDHALPAGIAGEIWHALLRAVESRSIDSWLALDLQRDIQEAGLITSRDDWLAGGRVRLTVVERAP
ncbi:MAG TPA: class I SAM-dependent methyltransferase [Gemmatimonadaceae bacterium]|nr:class I SAM-dependent methyltransferase [Gemmatimonadaceae bacterium]